MTRDEMHIKALSKGVDSQKIKGSMTVVLLGHAVDMMMELQDQHEGELKTKDEQIAELKERAKNSAEIYAKQLAAKDKKIIGLEVKLGRFCGLKKRGIK